MSVSHSKPARLLAALVALIAFCFSTPAISAQSSQANESVLDQLSNSLKFLSQRIAPAVVEIRVSGYGRTDDDDSDAPPVIKQRVIGSGVILDPNGYIITNAHVINGAKRIHVLLNLPRKEGSSATTVHTGDSPIFTATVVGTDQENDLAVLKIDATNLPTIGFANYEELKQGQMVIALGSPLGMQNVMTIGIVSSVARQIRPDDPAVYVQTDAAINPGNSGGPLVDTRGHLVGINTLGMSGAKFGLAIPSDVVKFVYEQLRSSGRVSQGDIGLEVQDITPVMAAAFKLTRVSGAIVSDVRPSSPAEVAGVKPGDIIVSTDGKITEAFADFVSYIHRKRSGERLVLVVLRGSSTTKMDIPVIEKKALQDFSSDAVDTERNLIAQLGVFGLDVDEEIAESLPGIRQKSGVLVTGKTMDEEGTESQSRFKVRDIIHALNAEPVSNIKELRAGLEKLQAGDPVVIRVERKRKFLFVTFELE